MKGKGLRYWIAVAILIGMAGDGGGSVRVAGRTDPGGVSGRPVLRGTRRLHFAGRLLLVPPRGDVAEVTAATADLKLLAELSDHDLSVAPPSAMRSSVSIREWIRSNTGIETDGLIVDPEVAADPGVAEVLASVRRERPRLPIDLVRDYGISSEADLSLRLARMILRRLGESFRILPYYTAVYTEAGSGSFRQVISRMIERVDGSEAAPGDGGGAPPDLMLFVVLPGTTPAGHQRLVDGLRQTINGNVQVALADLTAEREAKERLFIALRQERWIDRLAGIASSDPDSMRYSENAAARTIAQAVLFLAGVRSMRDDYDRLHRMDHARVRLLFTRCLRDYSYPLVVRPTLGEVAAANFEPVVLASLQPLASEIFNEQFRRNIHATRLVTGERARFEIALLQRLRLRTPVVGSDKVTPGILVSVHLAPLSQPGNLPQRGAVWEISNEELDQRLRDRWREIPWERFPTGAARVVVTFHGNQGSVVGSSESYRLRSRANRTTRRIDIFAATDRGRAYAISHLARLGAGGELERDLDLAESPQFAERGIVDNRGGEWSLRERLDLVKLLGRLRMNRYLLVLPAGGAAISAESVLQLERAAERSFIELEVVDEPPPHSRPLAPEDAVPCFASIRDPAVIRPVEMRGAMLTQVFGPPYSASLRLAAVAELAWSSGGYRPERAAEYLLVGEDPETIGRVQQLLPIATDCQPGKVLALTPSAANLIPRNGRRFLSLLRGELLQISRPISSRF